MKERLKSIVLWLLLAAALYLTLRTWVYDNALVGEWGLDRYPVVARLLGYSPAVSPGRFAPVRWQYNAAQWPVSCSVYREGERTGASRETTVLRVYEALRMTLGEALNTADKPEMIDGETWVELMGGEGFFFQYNDPVSLPLLAAWLSVGSALEAEVTAIGLRLNDGECRLVYRDGDGLFYSAAAEILWNGWPELPELAPCAYAFESEELPEETPFWVLLTEDRDGAALLRVTDALSFSEHTDAYASFLEQLGIDGVTTPSYPSEDARVYADGSRICRLGEDGSIRYSNPEAPSADSPLYMEDSERRTASRVERARALVATLESLLGDARFSLVSVREQEELTVAEFAVFSSGIPFGTTPAYAIITVGGGIIRGADIRLVRVEELEERAALLPLRYALYLSPGTPPGLYYRQREDGLFEPDWGYVGKLY